MGLKITKKSHYGVDANYWRIQRVTNLDYKGKVCELLLCGYINRESSKETFQIKNEETIREFPVQPIAQVGFVFSKKEFDFDFNDNLLKRCYEKIKAIEDWKDAVDVFEENPV